MTIFVIVTDATENTTHERSVDIDEKTTIPDLFSDLKIYRGDFSICYPLSGYTIDIVKHFHFCLLIMLFSTMCRMQM